MSSEDNRRDLLYSIMTISSDIVVAIWLILIVYWVISAFGAKHDIRKAGWHRSVIWRVVLFFTISVLLERRLIPHTVFKQEPLGRIAALIGIGICVLGVAVAIWARWHLGLNWSGSPAIKENHELITDGPYRLIRHPIYTGILVAFVGTALVIGIWAVIAFTGAAMIFVRRIRIEEEYMLRLFPDKYPKYRKHTWALIPFIF